ncbi:NB-ARC domain-containing protein [Actinosynnema sp. NPDC051121]
MTADSINNNMSGPVHGPAAQVGHLHGDLVFGPKAAPPPKPRQLPFGPTPFVGRKPQLATLTTFAETNRVLLVTSPTPGIGKSALALHWAHGMAERYPDGQLYVDLRGSGPLGLARRADDVVQDVLVAFGVTTPQHGPDGRLQSYRSLLAEKRVLLVLDDARDGEQVDPLLLPGEGSLVVVTSRKPLADLMARGARQVPVAVLERGDSAALLSARHADANPAAVGALVELCAGLPAALTAVAGAAGGGSLEVVAAELSAVPQVAQNHDPVARAQHVVAWAAHRERNQRPGWSGSFAVPRFAANGFTTGGLATARLVDKRWFYDHRVLVGMAVVLAASVTAVSTMFLAAGSLLSVLYFALRFSALGIGLVLVARSGPLVSVGTGLALGTTTYMLVDALGSIANSGSFVVWLELLTAVMFASLLLARVRPLRGRPRGLRVTPPARRPASFGTFAGVGLWLILTFVSIQLDDYTSTNLTELVGGPAALLPVLLIGGVCVFAALVELTDQTQRLVISAAATAYLVPEVFMLLGSFVLGDRMAYLGGGAWVPGFASPGYTAMQALAYAVVLGSTLVLLRVRH